MRLPVTDIDEEKFNVVIRKDKIFIVTLNMWILYPS